MNTAVYSLAAPAFEVCHTCGVCLAAEYDCDWCHFWYQLSRESERVQSFVMTSLWSAKNFARSCGIEVAS